jgi:hypothetical protein
MMITGLQAAGASPTTCPEDLMTELTKPVEDLDAAPVETALERAARVSVRELLTELAALEDATRAPSAKRRERLAALAREQEIIDELHRRPPESTPPV